MSLLDVTWVAASWLPCALRAHTRTSIWRLTGKSAPTPAVRKWPTATADELTLIHRFLHALFLAIDGNYKLNLRDKLADLLDFALTEKAGYFVNQKDFDFYVEGTANEPRDVSNKWLNHITQLTAVPSAEVDMS